MYPQHSPLECVYLYFVTVPISLLLADIMVEVQKPYTLKAVNAKDKGGLIGGAENESHSNVEMRINRPSC